MRARVGAADGIIFFDDGQEGGVVSCVDGMGEIIVGVFDKDGTTDVVFLYYRGHRVDNIFGPLLRVKELKFATFIGSQGVKKFLKCGLAIAVL